MMIRVRWFSALLAMAFAAAALADGGKVDGSITVNGKKTALKYAYARLKPDAFDKKKKDADTYLLVTDQEVPVEAVYDDMELMQAVDKLHLTGFSVEINDEKRIISGMIYSPELKKTQGSFSVTGVQTLETTTMTPSRIAGKVYIDKPQDFFGEKYQYSASFDVPITKAPKAAPVVLKGKKLPPDGGELGKAYTKYRKIIAAGDLAALRKAVVAARAKEMDSDPDFKKMFPLIQEMQPKTIKITGGAIDGDDGTLLVTSKEGGQVQNGNIHMIREGGQWKVEKESWKSKSE